MDIHDVQNIPENKFVFGLYHLKSSTIHLGTPSPRAPMGRGFHFEFLMQLTNIKSETEMLERQGQGEFAGFGFIREGNTIFLHPLSSLKAAGKIGNIVTVNPLLPKTNPIWPAVLPKPLAKRIFGQLAEQSGYQLEIDNDILNSSRFVFNEEKNGSKRGPMAIGIAARIKMATTYLQDIVLESNQGLMTRQLQRCQQQQ